MSEQEKFDVNKYQHQYKKDHYSEVRLLLPKENDLKGRIKACAEREGMSLNQFIIKAIEKELAWYE